MVKNQTWLDEWKNPWFWFYIIAMFLAATVLKLSLEKTKTFAILAMFAFPIIQFIYNIKYKIDKRLLPLGNYLRWGYFYILTLSAIIYLLISLKEIEIAISLLLFTFGSILFVTSILNVSLLCKSRGLKGVITAYLVSVFTIVVLFGFIYSISGTFDGHGLVDFEGNPIQEAWEYVYFSSSAFYTMGLGYLPEGASKIIMIMELAVSFIIHIFLLGILIPKIKDSPLFK